MSLKRIRNGVEIVVYHSKIVIERISHHHGVSNHS